MSARRAEIPWEQLAIDFDGLTYDHERDYERLSAQLRRVVAVLSDMRWHTLADIAAVTGDPEASISARIRDLRKSPTAWEVESQYVRRGLWRYRVVGSK